MEPVQEQKRKNKKFNLSVVKKAIKTASILFISIFFLSLFFANYTNKIVGSLVEELINYNSKGKYQISYKGLEYNFFNRVLTLRDLQFKYDSVAAQNEELLIRNQQNIFEAEIPYLYVDLENIWSIYIKKELRVSGIRLHKPHITIISYAESKGIEWQNDAGSLYSLVSDQLQVFKINDLEVEDGHFHFEKHVGKKRKYEIANVSFKIQNFLLDSEADENTEKFFYTDDIDIEFLDQEIYLKDSVHSLYFKRLLLSTTASEILVDSLVLQPRGNLTDDRKADAFNVFIPNIQIEQIDFKSAYNDGLLKIGDLHIEYPNIKISDKPRQSSEQDSVKRSFSKLALDYFNNIEIDTFNLNNGLFSYNFKSKTKSQGFSLDSFNIKLTQFKLDSSNIESQRPIYYDKIDFSVKDYTFNLPDSIHTLSFHLLKGSTDSRKIELNKLRIRPRSNVNIAKLLSKNHKNKTFEIYIPVVEIHRINGHDFLNTDTLYVDEMALAFPEIRITKYPNLKTDKRGAPDINNLYPFITDFLNAVYLKKVHLKNGNLFVTERKEKVQPIVTLTDVNFDLHNVALDSGAKSKNHLLSAEDIEINSKKTILEVPEKDIITSLDEFIYSSVSKDFRIKKFQLERFDMEVDSTIQESIAAAELNITGFDVNQFLKKEKQTIELLELKDPLITYNFNKFEKEKKKDTAKNRPSFHLPDINKLAISNGEVDLMIGSHKSIQANNIFFELTGLKNDSSGFRPLDLYGYDLSANNLTFKDANSKNIYSVNTIRYSQRDTCLSLNNIKIKHTEKGVHAATVDCTIPELAIYNWQPDEIVAKKNVNTEKIILKDPFFVLKLPKDFDTASHSKEGINKLLNTIRAREIGVENGNIRISKAIEDDSIYFQSSRINVGVTDLHIDSSRNHHHFLFSDDVSSSLTDNTITFYNSYDSIYIGKIENASKKKSFALENLFIRKHKELHPETFDEISIQTAYFEEFEFDKLKDKQVEIGRALLFRPSLELQLTPSADNKKTDLTDMLYLKSFTTDTSRVKNFLLGRLEVREGNVQLDLEDSIYSKKINLDDIMVDIKGFDLSRTGEQRIFKSDDVAMSFSGFEYHLPDSLNKISFDRVFFKVSDSSITLTNVLLDPKEEKYEYGHIVGDQTDYLRINVDAVKASGIDLHSLALNKNILAKKIDLDGLNIYAFRDKRIPRLTEKERYLPQKYLLDLKVPIAIDSLKVNKGKIEYEEFGEESFRPGSVDFKKLNASLINVTNIPERIISDPFCVLTANARLMNAGNLDLFIQFDLKKEKHPFFISAKLEEMDLTHLNKMLEPNAFVTIKKGYNDILTMSANADDDVAIGEMRFEYDNLKVSLVNKNTFENKGMGPVIGSFFANTFIINKSNPRLIIFKDGQIYFERNKYRSIFNYWAKIFFSGVVSSIGAKSNKKEIKKYEKMEDKLSSSK